ncbi:hypothetical protein IID20_01535 [Patescibacteria group bacterium]|nr:hypothetical protein [Patescibacteria group bacterium]
MNIKNYKDFFGLRIKIAFILILIIVLFLFINTLASSTVVEELVATYGYVGIFLMSILSGFNFLIPIPVISLLPILLTFGLDILTTIILITIGMTLGDILGYFIGKTGRLIVTPQYQRVFSRLEKIRERYNLAPLFVLFIFVSLVPLPNEILVIPLGFLGYRLLYIFPVVLLGNGIFNTIAAFGFLNFFEYIT